MYCISRVSISSISFCILSGIFYCPVALSSTVDDPKSFNWQGIEITPLLDNKIGYNDNIFKEGDSVSALHNNSAFFNALSPSIEFYTVRGLSHYTLNLAAKKQTYQHYSHANFIDRGVDMMVHQDFNSRHRLDITGRYGIYHDEGTARNGIDDLTPPQYINKKFGFVYGFGALSAKGRIDFFGNYDNKKYNTFLLSGVETKSGEDRKSHDFGGDFYYRLTAKTNALIEIKRRSLAYDNILGQQPGFDVNSYLAGFNWDVTGKTTGFVKLGLRRRDSNSDVPLDNQNSTGWETGINYEIKPYSLIQLSSGFDYGLDSDNPNIASFTKGVTNSIIWKHDWTELVATRLGASFIDEDILNTEGVETKKRSENTFSLGVDWAVKRNIALSFTWSHVNKKESAIIVATPLENYKQNIYTVSVQLAL